jgi:hypothetical protein
MLRWCARIARLGLLALLAVVLVHVAWPPFYRFAPASPFSGAELYDPYGGFFSDGLRANLHAHSRAWGPFTAGSNPLHEVRSTYERLGYDVLAVTDYQHISRAGVGADGTLHIPAYEHGFSLGQVHQTVLGPRSVLWFDFPLLPQGVRQKQYVIDLLRRDGSIVILNHPLKALGYSARDLAQLSGYTALEICSKYGGAAADRWDAALSAGRAVWGVSGDDGHNLARDSHTEIGWLVVHTRRRTREGIMDALRAGHFYSVCTRDKTPHNALRSAGLEDGDLKVVLAKPADRIRFVSQGGGVRVEYRDVSEATYRIRDEDPYVRVEAFNGRAALYLNPIFRHGGGGLSKRAEVAALPTWSGRALGALLLAALVGLLGRSRRWRFATSWRRRRRKPANQDEPPVASDDLDRDVVG